MSDDKMPTITGLQVSVNPDGVNLVSIKSVYEMMYTLYFETPGDLAEFAGEIAQMADAMLMVPMKTVAEFFTKIKGSSEWTDKARDFADGLERMFNEVAEKDLNEMPTIDPRNN